MECPTVPVLHATPHVSVDITYTKPDTYKFDATFVSTNGTETVSGFSATGANITPADHKIVRGLISLSILSRFYEIHNLFPVTHSIGTGNRRTGCFMYFLSQHFGVDVFKWDNECGNCHQFLDPNTKLIYHYLKKDTILICVGMS